MVPANSEISWVYSLDILAQQIQEGTLLVIYCYKTNYSQNQQYKSRNVYYLAQFLRSEIQQWLGRCSQFRVSHKALVKLSTGAPSLEELSGVGGAVSKRSCTYGDWQVASVLISFLKPSVLTTWIFPTVQLTLPK